MTEPIIKEYAYVKQRGRRNYFQRLTTKNLVGGVDSIAFLRLCLRRHFGTGTAWCVDQ